MLLRAEAGHYGVGCFNTPNLETIQAVIAAAEEENLPVILVCIVPVLRGLSRCRLPVFPAFC